MDNRKKIESVFLQLPIQEDRQEYLEAAINILLAIDSTGSGAIPLNFSDAGQTKTKKELKKLSRSDHPLEEIMLLHQPALSILADHGFLRHATPEDKVNDIARRAVNSELLEEIPISITGGRPRNERAHAIAILLAYYYELLTGKEPSRIIRIDSDDSKPHGPFMDLVNGVFAVLDQAVNTEDIAKDACKRYKNNK
jgi:hypothetical protein